MMKDENIGICKLSMVRFQSNIRRKFNKIFGEMKID